MENIRRIISCNFDEFKVNIDAIDLQCKYGKKERNLLHYVSKFGTLEMFKYVADKGVDMHLTDIDGKMPIHLACERGDDGLEIVKFLMENGAKLDFVLLLLACIANSLKLVEYFVENGLDINAPYDYSTTIQYACQNGDAALELVKYLVKNGGNTIGSLHFACTNGDNGLELVKYFVEECGLNLMCENAWGTLPIHIACERGDKSLQLVTYILERCKNSLNHANNRKYRPIHCACIRGDNAINLVKLLIDNGADPNHKNYLEEYPIHIACNRGDDAIELVKYLIKICGDKNLDETPIQYAQKLSLAIKMYDDY